MRSSSWPAIIACALPFCLGAQPYPRPPEARLRVEPAQVSAGESVHISWHTENAVRVFLSDSGIVGSSGERTITPEHTTTYVLAVEGKDGVVVRTARVVVTDGKGDDAFPPDSSFAFRFPHRLDALSFPDALDRVEIVLYKRLGYTVNTLQEGSGAVVFQTARRARTDISSDRRGVARWRAAFRLTLTPPAKPVRRFNYTIQPLVEYQLRRERSWRRESDPVLNEAYARQLADSLSSFH